MPLPITRGAASAQGFGFLQGKGSWWPVGTSFFFTPANTTGPNGPSNSTLLSYYSGQLFLPYFSSSSGTQILSNVPAGGYRILMAGAQGNDPDFDTGTGGFGAIIQCDFVFSEGSEIRMIVAQRGQKTSSGATAVQSQPGGGASSFWIGADAFTATQYGIAGGGGGAINGAGGEDATSSINGANSVGRNDGQAGASTDYSSGGAGWFSNASQPTALSGTRQAIRPAAGGFGFLSGGDYPTGNGSNGGFGGGGGQTNNGNNRAGGGAGYTGGDGRNAPSGGGGGGGSKFVGGTYGGTYVGPRANYGYIQITKLS